MSKGSKYTIISKQEFTSLYRFGSIPLDVKRLITEEKGQGETEKNIINGFRQLPLFDGDQQYLILKIQSTGKDQLYIEDILEIIPLTDAAKQGYELNFSDKIAFQPARFINVVTRVERSIQIQERLNGARAIWKLLNIIAPFKKQIDDKVIEIAYDYRSKGTKSNEIKKRDFLVFALVYSRYESFPRSDLGYFYDVGEIYAHFIGRPTFKDSILHTYLNGKKNEFNELNLKDLLKLFENASETKDFRDKFTYGKVREDIATILFLKFKDELKEKKSVAETIIPKGVTRIAKDKKYEKEFYLAIYLIGIFFGYNKFYSELYDSSDLSIHKLSQTPAPLKTNEPEEIKKGFKPGEKVDLTSEVGKGAEGEDDKQKSSVKTEKELKESPEKLEPKSEQKPELPFANTITSVDKPEPTESTDTEAKAKEDGKLEEANDQEVSTEMSEEEEVHKSESETPKRKQEREPTPADTSATEDKPEREPE